MPENKREDQLIKELEEILAKEGLSANPSEKGKTVKHNLCLVLVVGVLIIDKEFIWFKHKDII